jgi:hypothetical protein
MRCVRPTCAHLSEYGQPGVVRFLKDERFFTVLEPGRTAIHVAVRASVDRDGGIAGRCLPHGACRVPPLVPVVGFERPSRNFEGCSHRVRARGGQPTKTDSRTRTRESQGSPRSRTPSLWRLETLGEASCFRALQPFFTLVRRNLAAPRTRSRHEVAYRGDASLVFATGRPCCRTTCLLALLFTRIA